MNGSSKDIDEVKERGREDRAPGRTDRPLKTDAGERWTAEDLETRRKRGCEEEELRTQGSSVRGMRGKRSRSRPKWCKHDPWAMQGRGTCCWTKNICFCGRWEREGRELECRVNLEDGR